MSRLVQNQEARVTASRLADILDRLRRLERAPQLAHSSIDDGALSVYTGGTLALQVGTQYDGTTTAASVSGPTPPQPTAPKVTPVPGGLEVAWDGAFTDGSVAPVDYKAVEVVVASSPDADFLATPPRDSFISTRGGALTIVLLGQGTYYVALVTRSRSGKVSVPSDVASGVPMPIIYAYEDTKTVIENGVPQVIRLARTPLTYSEHVYWNGVYQPPSQWTRVGRKITMSDPTPERCQVGDVLACEYLQTSAFIEPAIARYREAVMATGTPYFYFRMGDAGSLGTLTSPFPSTTGLLNETDPGSAAVLSGTVMSDVQAGILGDNVQSMTVAAILKPELPDTDGAIYGLYSSIAASHTYWMGIQSDGKPFFFANKSAPNRVVGPKSLVDGQTHHVAYTWNRTTFDAKVYVDGQRVAALNLGGLMTLGTGAQMVGGGGIGGGRYYRGVLDELSRWNRVLSFDEIADLYDAWRGV